MQKIRMLTKILQCSHQLWENRLTCYANFKSLSQFVLEHSISFHCTLVEEVLTTAIVNYTKGQATKQGGGTNYKKGDWALPELSVP